MSFSKNKPNKYFFSGQHFNLVLDSLTEASNIFSVVSSKVPTCTDILGDKNMPALENKGTKKNS